MSKKCSVHTFARPTGAARVPGVQDDFLAVVRAVAKRHAQEDHAAEIAALAASQPAIGVKQ
jgi:hypothetical protein